MKELKESRCSVCGNRIEQSQNGRRRKYCSEKCRHASGNRKNAMKPKLPAGLTKCVQCGKEFERPANSGRECCSNLCAHTWGRRYEIEEIRRLAAAEKQQESLCLVRDWALELHYNGYERTSITEALGLSRRQLKRWLTDYTKGSDGCWHGSWEKKRGTYPWPGPKLGAAISITAEDFECVLRGERGFSKYSNRPIRWDSIDLQDTF
jgi:endogenous inhibitor of DNA gyrase (YacG/DUF329 family)